MPGLRLIPILAVIVVAFVSVPTVAAQQSPTLTVTGSNSGPPNRAVVRWDSGDADGSQVYVSINDGPDALLANASHGVREVDWISTDARYAFSLYAGRDHTQLLVSVVVPVGSTLPPAPSAAQPFPVQLLGLALLGSIALLSITTVCAAVLWRSPRRLSRAVAAVVIGTATLPVFLAPALPIEQQPSDAAEYADGAHQLVAGNGYVTYVHGDSPQPPRYPPGFSFALAPFAAIGDYPTNVQFGARIYAALYVVVAGAAAWAIAGAPAAAIAAALVGLSPFAQASGGLVMSDAFAAALTIALMLLARHESNRTAALAGALAGLLALVRLSALVALPALLLVVPSRLRYWVLVGAAPPLVALGLFQWLTFGSPLRTGYDYWLAGVPTFDLSFATAAFPFGDGPWIVADRLHGALMQWVCPCESGGPQASTPNLPFYPAVVLGVFWIFAPPFVTIAGFGFAWIKRHSIGARFTLVLTVLSVALFWVYFAQGARFMAAPATLLVIYTAAGISYVAAADWTRPAFDAVFGLTPLRRNVAAVPATANSPKYSRSANE